MVRTTYNRLISALPGTMIYKAIRCGVPYLDCLLMFLERRQCEREREKRRGCTAQGGWPCPPQPPSIGYVAGGVVAVTACQRDPRRCCTVKREWEWREEAPGTREGSTNTGLLQVCVHVVHACKT